jgi:hypothetical protein
MSAIRSVIANNLRCAFRQTIDASRIDPELPIKIFDQKAQ